MALLLTQVQGRQALKNVLHSPMPSLTRFNVEPSKVERFGLAARDAYQNEAGMLRLTNFYQSVAPVISGGFLPIERKISFSFKYYNYLARTYPWRVGIVTACTKAVLADILAQKVIEKKEKLDLKRTGVFFTFGAIYSGIICQTLYSFTYPALFTSRIPQINALASSLADNLINTPFVLFPTLFALKELFLADKFSMDRVVNKYKSEIWESVTTSWKIWVPAHCVTFSVVPVHLRLPFVSVISFFFFTIISLQQAVWEKQKKLEA